MNHPTRYAQSALALAFLLACGWGATHRHMPRRPDPPQTYTTRADVVLGDAEAVRVLNDE